MGEETVQAEEHSVCLDKITSRNRNNCLVKLAIEEEMAVYHKIKRLKEKIRIINQKTKGWVCKIEEGMIARKKIEKGL